ncbi:hypothetical protein [Lactiplantibacillus plajomi]|uniref:Extracellular protein n=1 Tax=Lactiplantibacillus plajomi TaxID=1457217 RepID=A0ABV6K2W7_9LACO|nr:hypothetical protein [Lactiplantibacillus plajomi]
MNKLLSKLTIALMAAGTLYATTATASANVQPTTTTPTTHLVKRVTRSEKLALGTPKTKTTLAATPAPLKSSIQSRVLATVDTSSQSLTKLKYANRA